MPQGEGREKVKVRVKVEKQIAVGAYSILGDHSTLNAKVYYMETPL